VDLFPWVNWMVVEGGGTINGMGQEWWAQSCKRNKANVMQFLILCICLSVGWVHICIIALVELQILNAAFVFYLQPCRSAPMVSAYFL
jgi:hypothetical protein